MDSPRLTGLPLMLFGLVPAWLAWALIAPVYPRLHDHFASRYWTKVPCEIIGHSASAESGQYADATLRFRYETSGITHQATQEIACHDAAAAKAVIAAHPLGAATCLIDPARPEKAMLVRSAPRGMAINAIVGGLAALVATILFTCGVARLSSRDGGVGRWPERTAALAFGSVFTTVGLMTASLVFDENIHGVAMLLPLAFGGAFASVGIYALRSKTETERHRVFIRAFASGDVELTPDITSRGNAIIAFVFTILWFILGATVLFLMRAEQTAITPGGALGLALYAVASVFVLKALPDSLRAARRPRIRVVVTKTPTGTREVRWWGDGDTSGYAKPSFLWVKQVLVRSGRGGKRYRDAEMTLLWRGKQTLEKTGSYPLPEWQPMEGDTSIRIIRLATTDPVSGTPYSIDYHF